MRKFAGGMLILIAGLLLTVGLRFSAAQSPDPVPIYDDGCYGIPAEPSDEVPGDKAESDEVRLRAQANRALIGDLTDEMKQNAIRELQRQQRLYPQLMPGAQPPPGVPAWTSLGPTQAKYETNRSQQMAA